MSAAPSGETLFAWHHGRRALIFPGPDGQVCGITIGQLAAVGYWKLDELALRRSLPRFDHQSTTAH
jgi:hypothetical protein